VPAPYASRKLYVEAKNAYTEQAEKWKDSDPLGAQLMAALGKQPSGAWIGGSGGNPESAVDRELDKAGDALVTFVAYNIPKRDLGSHSAGGAADRAAYLAWCQSFAKGLRGRFATVTLEPDAVAASRKMDSEGQGERLAMIAEAVEILTEAGAAVYIDCGSSNWIRPDPISELLIRAGIEKAAGFSLNTSGTQFTEDEVAYGVEIRKRVGKAKGFLVDTGRNGRGPYRPCPGEHEDIHWLNAPGRGCGMRPTLRPGVAYVNAGMHAALWLKRPGSSDGVRQEGDLPAGKWSATVAREQALRAVPFLVPPKA
jgi:endoglucanase